MPTTTFLPRARAAAAAAFAVLLAQSVAFAAVPQLAALDWLGRVRDQLVGKFKVPIPYVYPTPQGRVRAGWVTS